MKWSEQMRVLQSEDQHYNQLMLDTETGMLFINEELIDILPLSEEGRTLEALKFKEIIKKYPFFNDVQFLLNCIFRFQHDNSIYYMRVDNVVKHKNYYEIFYDSKYITDKLLIYFKKPKLE